MIEYTQKLLKYIMPANHSERKSILIIGFVFFLITAGTVVTSFFARGYQISFHRGPVLTSTGLLSATSKPKSASVYVNDRLITATDDTLNLPPGDYKVKITKDGYLPWEKDIVIKKEVVFQTDANLFRSVPDIKSLSFTGAINPAISPDGSRIIFAVASASASKDNGLYLIEPTDNPLLVNKNIPRQISPNYSGIDWSKATYEFSPNSRQLLATFSPNTTYLLNLDSPITQKTLLDVTYKLASIHTEWRTQYAQIIASKIDRLPKELKTVVSTESARDISISPSDDKVLYLAQSDTILSDHLIDAPPAQSTQPQSRTIKKDNYYVYDLKDDTNFLIGSKADVTNIDWIPNSNTLYLVQGKEIKGLEYDATNKVTLFGGNFKSETVSVWPDGSRLVVLTTPYTGAQENLYTISIK